MGAYFVNVSPGSPVDITPSKQLLLSNIAIKSFDNVLAGTKLCLTVHDGTPSEVTISLGYLSLTTGTTYQIAIYLDKNVHYTLRVEGSNVLSVAGRFLDEEHTYKSNKSREKSSGTKRAHRETDLTETDVAPDPKRVHAALPSGENPTVSLARPQAPLPKPRTAKKAGKERDPSEGPGLSNVRAGIVPITGAN